MKYFSEPLQRICTAFPLIGIAILSTFYFDWLWFTVGNTVLMCLLGWEWSRLLGDRRFQYYYLGALLVGCASIAYIPMSWLFCLSSVMSMLLVAWAIKGVYKNHITPQPVWRLRILGGAYFVLNWCGLVFLKGVPIYLALALLVIALTDTLAYVIGKYSGTIRLVPAISPHKTWEGFIAGLIGPTILLLLIDRWTDYSFYISTPMVVVMLMTSLAATAGDLFESAIKRQYGLKNSGHSLPGHGGWLDRFDSLVCAIPVFASGLFYLATFFNSALSIH